ncbi:RluA family pseudouridine synthase [Zavarzinella formosa]|uniref:RluA family pseudouridine synthase n=1 Tax=Zavarzinella formosa TaxID=360055 RepID=UPI0002E45910|nr:RluA family pseudouridine synthase [Zavarzinella formosa]
MSADQSPLNSSPQVVSAEQAGQTLSAFVRTLLPGQSWSAVRGQIERRHVTIGGSVCMDPARRLKAGETVELRSKPVQEVRGERPEDVVIRHLDADVVVVEKVSGLNTVRHPAELDWTEARRELAPTLEDVTQKAIGWKLREKPRDLPRLRIVQRLDKDTSGLVVFARSVRGERELGRQFKDHTVVRRYVAIVPGHMEPQTIRGYLVRDRGDGRRGSGAESGGKFAVTHVTIHEKFPNHTALICQLETGRTHQIRIHLSEAGHFICGEKVYTIRPDGSQLPDPSNAPRLALHALELGFVHPGTEEKMFWSMPLPVDLQKFMERLRAEKPNAPRGKGS